MFLFMGGVTNLVEKHPSSAENGDHSTRNIYLSRVVYAKRAANTNAARK